MGYYCTVPQCTSLAGKTKNVKFHRFPRDEAMAEKWNKILKRMKPYTKYSKVCSLHFIQSDYNVTTMGQWKTLSKDAVPSQNLPKLNPDGSVMVIRKSRTLKIKDSKKDEINGEKLEKWQQYNQLNHYGSSSVEGTPRLPSHPDSTADDQSTTPPQPNMPPSPENIQDQEMVPIKPKKQDAFIQTDPYLEDEDVKPNTSFSESASTSDTSYKSELDYTQPTSQSYQNHDQDSQEKDNFEQKYDPSKDYVKSDYIPQTNEEYNDEAEKYALERKSLNTYEKLLSENSYQKQIMAQNYQKLPENYQKLPDDYQKLSENYQKLPENYQKLPDNYQKLTEDYPKITEGYHKLPENYQKSSESYQKAPENYQKPPENYQRTKLPDMYFDDKYNRTDYLYQNTYSGSVEILRNQQHNLQMLQQQRLSDNPNFFNENHIKQEIDITQDEDKYLYEGSKEQINETNSLYNDDQRCIQQQRLLDHLQSQVKQEPEGCDNAMQPHRYFQPNGTDSVAGYYEAARPGPELLIAKQNALAAHTQLWQNTMKRPFFYSENPHFNSPPAVLHRYEDITRILQ